MKKVLDVGQCNMDHPRIKGILESLGAQVTRAYTADDAMSHLQQGGYDLVLVNRLLNDDGSPGMNIIRSMKADPRLKETPVMLVSNYADAQQEAEKAGAVKGFGKDALNSDTTKELLASYLK